MKVAVDDFRFLMTFTFIIHWLRLRHVSGLSSSTLSSSSTTTTNLYGVDLELLKIRPSQPPNSFQFELQVDYTHSGNMIDYGMVTVRTVASNHELIFPEFANRNPFNLKVESQGVICFRLYQTNKIIMEDCLQIRDLSSNNFYYNTETFTKTKADGTTLTYKINQYLINDNVNNVNDHDAVHEFSEQFIVDAQSQSLTCPVCSCSCTLPVVFAVLEGLSLFVIISIFIYSKNRNKNNKSNNLKQSAAPITVANNGSGLSKNSLTWTTTTSTKSDIRQNEIYSNAGGNSISSDSTNTDRSSSSNDTTASSAAMTTKRTLLKKLPSMGRKIAEVFRNAKLKPNDEPPEPPPPDYRNETFDVDDQPERVYDCIDERKLNDIVYAK